jgi:hypothetical protein
MGVTLEPLQLVSGWMPGGELRTYIKENPDTNLISLVSRPLPAGMWSHPLLSCLVSPKVSRTSTRVT